ncbi:MAG: hypothetical protein QOH81_798 [Sphingomonadales bacterium]|jgi:hypothetical protein|nr:hypothetical protein [Sphingomonadales bacterium]
MIYGPLGVPMVGESPGSAGTCNMVSMVEGQWGHTSSARDLNGRPMRMLERRGRSSGAWRLAGTGETRSARFAAESGFRMPGGQDSLAGIVRATAEPVGAD